MRLSERQRRARMAALCSDRLSLVLKDKYSRDGMFTCSMIEIKLRRIQQALEDVFVDASVLLPFSDQA
jgi:hypothetical protein